MFSTTTDNKTHSSPGTYQITCADSSDNEATPPARTVTVAAAESSLREISGLTLSSTAPGTITVTWNAPNGEQPKDYRLSWAKADQPYLTWTDSTGNAFPTGTSHTITDLEEGETYKVKARTRYDTNGSSLWSAEFTITVAGTR